jgi:hypothetical protein
VATLGEEALEMGARLTDRIRPHDADRAEAVLARDGTKPVFQKSRFA